MKKKMDDILNENLLLQATRRMGDPRHMSLHPMPAVQQAHQQATLQVVMMIVTMTMMRI